jgi:hypothetical protein
VYGQPWLMIPAHALAVRGQECDFSWLLLPSIVLPRTFRGAHKLSPCAFRTQLPAFFSVECNKPCTKCIYIFAPNCACSWKHFRHAVVRSSYHRGFGIRIVCDKTYIEYYQRFLIHQLMHKWIVLKINIKIYIKTAPTCFGVITPSSGGPLFGGSWSYSF